MTCGLLNHNVINGQNEEPFLFSSVTAYKCSKYFKDIKANYDSYLRTHIGIVRRYWKTIVSRTAA